MKTQTRPTRVRLPHDRKSCYSTFGSFTALAALLALFGGQPNAKAQTETFDGGSAVFTPGPNAWLKSEISSGAPQSYTFPATDWGKGVRIQSLTYEGALPAAVAFMYRTNIYHDFYVAVDFVAWTDLDQAILLIAHGQPAAPPQDAAAYIINYDVSQYGQSPTSRRQGQFQLSVVFPGFATIQLGIAEFTLVAGGHYRLVLKGVDNAGTFDITAQVYDHTDLTKPLVTIFGQDGTYSDGVSGIGNFSRAGATGTTDSTFDNYYAAGVDPNLDIAPAIRHPIAGTAQVVTRTPAERYTNFYPPTGGISFTARTFTADNIKVSATKLYLNNVDVSASLSTPADAPNVSFTTPTSPLVANKVYSARIEVESVTGLKGTNTFWFDTFSDVYLTTAPVRTVECEDYNNGNGLFQTEPILVSGFDTNGVQVNGGGVGYLGLAGTEGVDFHDNRTTPEGGVGTSFGDFNAYRPLDTPGTYPGEYELEDALHIPPVTNYDPPIALDHTRLKYATLGMKEYEVVRTEVGEWLNYTRVFANQNYNVYLRVGTFGATEVTLDTVTSNPTLPGQTTTPLGKFYVPNQFMHDNYRYQPLYAAGVPAVVNLSGTQTIRLTMAGTMGQDSRKLYLNYLLFVPTSDAVTDFFLASSSTVNGTYTDAAGASVNTGTKTITVPVSGSAQFYRIVAGSAVTITSINVVGGIVTITYTP